MKKVLVTGSNGYIAKHIILELYKRNYSVRGTVRDLNYAHIIQSDIEKHLGRKIDIEFVEANLNLDAGWENAVENCEAILHTASPFPLEKPKNEDDLILPAKEGTLRVFNAALSKSINRIIVTSSSAAVYDGNKKITSFDENIWTNIHTRGVSAYTKSKTIAEKSAWDFVSKHPIIQLSTINPVLVWGPGIGNHLSSASLNIFKMLMKREMPMIPRIKVPLVDVRDVAKAHVDAIELNDSIGKRFLLCENTYWMRDISYKMNSLGYNAPTVVAPDFLIKFLALFNNTLKEAARKLKYDYCINSNQAKAILGFNPIEIKKTLQDTHNYLNNLIK